MIDPRRYDDADRAAMMQVGDWRAIGTFRPNFFQSHGFPIRVTELGEIRYLFSAMNDAQDAGHVLHEMRGLRPADLDALREACLRFARFHTVTTNVERVTIPYTALLYYYSLFKKLTALPRHSAVLDIGSGLGYLPFFIAGQEGGERAGIRTYHQIEVTQSLYVLQSAINSFVFGEGYRDHAAGLGDPAGTLQAVDVPRPVPARNTINLRLDFPKRCATYPWWRMPEAFATTYDVVMLNENICEMDLNALVYFFDRLRTCLEPDGVVLVHGIGKTVGDRDRTMTERLGTIAKFGFRALVSVSGYWDNGRLSRPNFILVGPQHERYAEAGPDLRTVRFDTRDPLVRAVYGIDEPAGEMNDLTDLAADLTGWLQSAHRGAA